jgi:hypothetical protein
MNKISLFFILTFILFGCAPEKDKKGGLGYFKDSTLTNLNGYLFDSTKSYFPEKYFSKDKWHKIMPDKSEEIYSVSFWTEEYSEYLKYLKVPVLYNYYLGSEMYRFLWIRSFHEPVLITVINNDDRFSINTKVLNEHINTWTLIYNNQVEGKVISLTKSNDIEALWKENPNADSIVLPRNNIKYLIDTTFEIDSEQWNEFLGLINLCGFWEQKPMNGEGGLDGAQWVLEGQTYDKYHFVSRWSPRDEFRVCCEYLIRISQLQVGKRSIY